jgi:holliday junction DNA helicase RuvA
MIYSVSGVLRLKNINFAVIEAHGVGYKVYVPKFVSDQLPALGEQISLFCHLHVREDAQDLYGFLTDTQLSLFESLISVNGVGPKSAMSIMSVLEFSQLIAAINEGRVDLLSKATGVGKKTAERVCLELKGKLTFADTSVTLAAMESDAELEETLVNLGYSKSQARTAIGKVDKSITSLNERLKAVLKEYKK